MSIKEIKFRTKCNLRLLVVTLHLYRENQYDHKLTFSHWYVSWYWQISLDAPCSIPRFTGGLTNCDYLKGSLLRVFPFNQTETPFTEQAVARFILMQTVKKSVNLHVSKRCTSVEKSSSTGPSASSKHSFPSLLYVNIPSNKNLSPKCPNRFLVDFNYQSKLSRIFRVTLRAKNSPWQVFRDPVKAASTVQSAHFSGRIV